MRPKRLIWLISFLRLRGGSIVLALGVVQAAAFAGYLAGSVFTVPFWDTLDWIDEYFRAPSLGEWLWRQHVDVRQVAVKALIALDLGLFGGWLLPIAVVAYGCMVGAVVALARATWVSLAVSELEARAFCVGVLLVLGFQTFTLPSYMATNTLQHALVCALVIFSVVFIADARSGVEAGGSVRWWRVGGAIFAAALASVTYVNGFLAWPLIVWVGWRRGLGRRAVVAMVVVGAALAFAHLAGMERAVGHPDPFQSLAAPLELTWFVVEFFATPWIKVPVLAPFGLIIGVVIGLIAGVALLRHGWGGRRAKRLPTIGLAVLAFAFGSALMIGLARVGMVDLYRGGTRFGIYAAVAHMGLAMLAFTWVERVWSRAKARIALVGVALLVVVPLGAQQVVIGNMGVAARGTIDAAGAGLRAGSDEARELRVIHPDPERAAAIVAVMRARGVYGFAVP